MTKIQKADPQARRRALLLILPAALFGGVLIGLVQSHKPRLRELMLDNADWLVANPLLVGLGMLVLTSPLLGLSIYLMMLGQRIVRARHFPPPGMAVSRDTPVLREGVAVARGRLLQALSGVLLIMGLVLCVLVAAIVGMLAG